MSFFHNKSLTSPLRKVSRKKPPKDDDNDKGTNDLEDNGSSNGGTSQSQSRNTSTGDLSTPATSRKPSTSTSHHNKSQQSLSEKRKSNVIPEHSVGVYVDKDYQVRENPNFNPSQQEILQGDGVFEKGDSKHDIGSKEDYELCKDQVTSESGVDKVKEHFKLVRDLKPLDATDGMDAELDKTKSPDK